MMRVSGSAWYWGCGMPVSRDDWSLLRGAIGVFVICLMVGGVLLGASYYFREEMAAEYRAHHARFRDVSRKYLAVDDEERIIDEAYPGFVRLYEAGILGAEHRLSWVETLRAAGERLRLPALDYQVSSQRVFEPEFSVQRGAFDINVSEMEIRAGLLHEGDLFGLFAALDRDAEGLYTVAQCDIARTGDGSVPDANIATINAQCRLDWLTVDLKGNKGLSL